MIEPITGELLNVLKGDCKDVVDFAAKDFHVDLSFNDESIVWLSSFIEEQRGQMDAETRRSYSVRIGIFLGFAIIERYGGEWVNTEGNNPAVRFSTGAMAFPLTKASKQFENGMADNIHGLYRNIGRLLRREFEPGTPSNAGSTDASPASTDNQKKQNLSRTGLLCLLFLGCIAVSLAVYAIARTSLQNGYAMAVGLAGIGMILIVCFQWPRSRKG